jgi:probable HAF family extracellular repeat protein
MRPLALSSIMLSAVFVVGCGVDNIQAPSPSARPPLLARGESRAERAFDFTTIDVPGAVFTSASGINPRGDIVGNYTDGTGRTHGFLLRDGEFTTIDFRDAAGTVVAGTGAAGIGPSGEIVGSYSVAGEPAVNSHGYLLTKQGEFVAVNYPGHTNTTVQRILPDGTILGCRHDNDNMGSMKGVVITRSGSEEIGLFASMTNGATPDHRRIVGFYRNMAANRNEGFLIDDGDFTPLVVPGSTGTSAWDMNPAGEIVGVYTKAGVHGFVLRDEGYVTIDFPGATVTRVFGINARGDVVGNYVAAGQTHGYLASR